MYSGELPPGNVASDAGGRIVAPGCVEASFHPWVFCNPVSLVEDVGWDQKDWRRFPTTRGVPPNRLWAARLVSQAKFAGEVETFALEKRLRLLERPDVAGTGEAAAGGNGRSRLPDRPAGCLSSCRRISWGSQGKGLLPVL